MRTIWLLALLMACGPNDDKDTPTDSGAPVTTVQTHWALDSDFLNIAHRGGALLGPENTIEGIQAGIDAGAKIVEFDVFRTSDGELVLFHDATVDNLTDGTGAISNLTLAEVQALDAAYTFTTDGTTFPLRGTGVQIPTLRSVFEAFPDMHWDVEIKQNDPPIYDDVVTLIEAFGLKDQVCIAAFDEVTVVAFRAAHPGWVTNMSEAEWTAFVALQPEAEANYVPPGQIAQIPYYFYNDTLVAKAERVGIKLHLWTVNSEVDMRTYLDGGVHGIITDDPGLLLGIMEEKGVPGF
ncbi:MAG: hypothetical protein GWP91_20710 [Rhodobacterales bacterium]|nr:hypothetical protein [Rhodobacterales bacterium]